MDRSIAAIVQLKHVSVSVVPPPGAQLSVPSANQGIKEFGMLHADHGEEILVPQVAPEAILVSQFGHMVRFQQLVVERRRSHASQVQQHHPAVEAWETIGVGFSDLGLRVLLTVLPEGVSGERGRSRLVYKTKHQMIASVRLQLDLGVSVNIPTSHTANLCRAFSGGKNRVISQQG